LGLISGLLIHFLQIPPIITTIATLDLYFGCFGDSNLGSNPSGRNDAESFSSAPSQARIFHEKCARRAEPAALAFARRLFGANPAQWPESKLLFGR
jgi:hypothetical protein